MHLVTAAGEADVVLLSCPVPESQSFPVVRGYHVLFPIVVEDMTQRCVWVDTAVSSNKVFTVRYSENLIAQTTLVRWRQKLFVGFYHCLCWCQAKSVELVIIQCFVIILIIFCRIADDIVVSLDAGVGTPFHVDRDAGVACLCTFGRHHDDAVGTACAVESRRGGVLQHRHGGHVGRVDVVPAAVIGRTVDDDQRALSGADAAEASYTDGGCRSRLTAVVYNLDTGGFTFQAAHYVVQLLVLHLLRVDDGGRTRESGTFLLSEGRYDNLVQSRVVVDQCHLHLGPGDARKGLHADIADFHLRSGLHIAQHETSFSVGHGYQLVVAHNLHRRTDDGFAGLVDDDTLGCKQLLGKADNG